MKSPAEMKIIQIDITNACMYSYPQFDQIVDYFAAQVPEPRPYAFIEQPADSFSTYARVLKYQRGRRRGLHHPIGTNLIGVARPQGSAQ
jgi:hypothetical protein